MKKLLLAMTLPLLLLAEPVTLDSLKGDWHLKVMDGYNVRKARAILDFHPPKMRIEGFDSCNRISGTLNRDTNGTYTSQLITTRMACRDRLTRFVSGRLHETIQEGFSIEKSSHNGKEGITLKSKTHTLFFRRMGE
jgi:heat shock protein HslJ